MRLTCVLLCAFIPSTAFGQTGASDVRCAELMKGQKGTKAFVNGMELPAFENASTIASGKSAFKVCVAVDPQRHAAQGMVNIRYQIYTAAASSSGGNEVEYESDTNSFGKRVAARRQQNKNWLPSVTIHEYQNYHGCRDSEERLIGRSYYLHSEFHSAVGNQRSDTLDRRRQFLFSKDIGERCHVGSSIAGGVFEGLSWFGVSRAFGFSNPGVDRIVGRRSINVRYNFRNDNGIRFVSYVIPPLGSGRCIRISANHVFWRKSPVSGFDEEPLVVGYTCTD